MRHSQQPANGYSGVVQMPAGDSHCWLVSDTTNPAGNSYFTSTGYAGCSCLPFTLNWHISVGTAPDCALLINGGSSATIAQDGGEVCFVFYGPAFQTPGVLFLCSPFLLKLLSITTDTFAPGPCPNSWALCANFSCADPAPLDLTFCHFFFDLTDLKPNGKPKVKLETADLHIVASPTCVPNFGIKDDCILDATIWKVMNPSGASDWFNVNLGTTAGVGVNNITGLEISSWDFCGSGPSWAEVGCYPASRLDPCTPDTSSKAGAANSLAMAPAAGDWGCPMTFYDTPDIVANSSTVYHVAAHWNAGDSCTWLGSDTDGTDSGLGSPIPNNGCCSLFALDDYATPAVTFTPCVRVVAAPSSEVRGTTGPQPMRSIGWGAVRDRRRGAKARNDR